MVKTPIDIRAEEFISNAATDSSGWQFHQGGQSGFYTVILPIFKSEEASFADAVIAKLEEAGIDLQNYTERDSESRAGDYYAFEKGKVYIQVTGQSMKQALEAYRGPERGAA